jgi:pyruvate ferredoxin oxidoreductase gamma subunit
LLYRQFAAGKYAQGFPVLDRKKEARPLHAFTRIDDKKINVRSGIYETDVVLVLDSTSYRLGQHTRRFEANGKLIVNTAQNRRKQIRKN